MNLYLYQRKVSELNFKWLYIFTSERSRNWILIEFISLSAKCLGIEFLLNFNWICIFTSERSRNWIFIFISVRSRNWNLNLITHNHSFLWVMLYSGTRLPVACCKLVNFYTKEAVNFSETFVTFLREWVMSRRTAVSCILKTVSSSNYTNVCGI